MATVSGGEKMERVLRDLEAKLGRARAVRVGFLEDATYPDGSSVAQAAAINNYGAPGVGIPSRPFFTDMVAQKSPEWGKRFWRVLKAADYDTDAALNRMGEGIATQLRQAIVDTNDPPNSAVTNLLKQRFPMRDGMTFSDVQKARADVHAGITAAPGKPLVWTGVMLNSVGVEVE